MYSEKNTHIAVSDLTKKKKQQQNCFIVNDIALAKTKSATLSVCCLNYCICQKNS